MLRGNQGDQTAEIQILELNSLAARQAEMALLSGFHCESMEPQGFADNFLVLHKSFHGSTYQRHSG